MKCSVKSNSSTTLPTARCLSAVAAPVQFGTARIDTHLDMEALDADKRQWLTTAFEGKAPLEGHTVIGFGGGTSYDFSTNPLKVDQDGTTATAESITLSGTCGG